MAILFENQTSEWKEEFYDCWKLQELYDGEIDVWNLNSHFATFDEVVSYLSVSAAITTVPYEWFIPSI